MDKIIDNDLKRNTFESFFLFIFVKLSLSVFQDTVIVYSCYIDLSCGLLVLDVFEFLINLLKTVSGVVKILIQHTEGLVKGKLNYSVGSKPKRYSFEILFWFCLDINTISQHKIDWSG